MLENYMKNTVKLMLMGMIVFDVNIAVFFLFLHDVFIVLTGLGQ